MLTRRTLLVSAPALGVLGCATGPKVYKLDVSRDDGCTCCAAWAADMEKTGRFKVSLVDVGDGAAYKRKMGVPDDLAACHTALVGGYVIEGHVPAADILKLVETQPGGVVGLAVSGMPRGSPGMEQANGVKDAFTVYAFKVGGMRSEFATYAAEKPTA